VKVLEVVSNATAAAALLVVTTGWGGVIPYNPRAQWRPLMLLVVGLALYAVNGLLAATCRARFDEGSLAVGYVTRSCTTFALPDFTYRAALTVVTLLALNYRLGGAIMATSDSAWTPATPHHYDMQGRYGRLRGWLLAALASIPVSMLLRAAGMVGRQGGWVELMVGHVLFTGTALQGAWECVVPLGWHYATYETAAAKVHAASSAAVLQRGAEEGAGTSTPWDQAGSGSTHLPRRRTSAEWGDTPVPRTLSASSCGSGESSALVHTPAPTREGHSIAPGRELGGVDGGGADDTVRWHLSGCVWVHE